MTEQWGWKKGGKQYMRERNGRCSCLIAMFGRFYFISSHAFWHLLSWHRYPVVILKKNKVICRIQLCQFHIDSLVPIAPS